MEFVDDPNDDFEIIDDTGGGYKDKRSMSYQEILMNQLSRITKIASQELKEGFWKTLPMKSGTGAMMMTRIWVSDGRKEYINAINCLDDILLPMYDEEMKTKSGSLSEELKKIKEECAKQGKTESQFTEFELKICRELFRQLNLLIGRMGYFEESFMTT